jgi:hypothetical protein
MAQIDPSIALSIKPIQIESPLVHAARAAELQGAQQTQLMNMLKMKEFADESRNKNAMTQWLAGKPNLDEDINLNHLATQFGAQGLALAKQIDDRRKARGEADYRAAQITDLASQRAKRESDVNATQREQAIRTISGFRTRADALDMLYTAQANKTISDEAAENIRRMMPYDEEGFGQFKKDLLATIASPDAIMGADKPPTPTEAQRNYQAAKDDGFTGTFAAFLDRQKETEAEREWRLAKRPKSEGGEGYKGSFLDYKRDTAKATKFVIQTSSTPTLSKDAIDDQANRFLTDGTLPSLGMGKDAVANRNAIINRASALAREQGLPNDRVSQLANKANTSALTQLTKQETAVGAFEKTFVKNVNIVDRLSKQTDNTGVPLLQKWINEGKRAGSGDPKLASLAVAIKAVQNEYGKIVSGSMGNTAVAVSEIKRMEKLLNDAQTPQDVQAALNTMREETNNRMEGFKEQKAELLGSMRGSTNKPATPANRPPLNEIFGGKK